MGKPVILCVDDERMILDNLEEQITGRLGAEFDVELAESGHEGLEIVQELNEERRNIALIISDQLMPGMKGDEFLIQVHSFLPQTLKILLTGQASLDSVRRTINQARLYRYIAKPWEENDLLLTVEEACKSYMQYLQLMQYTELLRALNKATQELSGEINLNRLVEKFIDTTVKSTGAEKGYLLVDKGGEPILEAVASVIQDETVNVVRSGEIKKKVELGHQILEKVQKTLSNREKEAYRLATAVEYKGKKIGYVYVENVFSQERFNENQREILQMLASQAAISIENAQLYEKLEQKNQDITDSIRYARRIQDAIMPQRDTLHAVLPNSFVLYKAKDIVSGDFYWWSARGEHVFVAAVDCTGHGVPGAFMSVIGSSFLNQLINENGLSKPEEILVRLHHQVHHTLNKESAGATTKDGMDLALCVIDKTSKTLYYAGARRPLWQVKPDGQIIVHEANKRSIGEVIDGVMEFDFTGITVEFSPDDDFYIFTDGITDQFGGPHNKKFKYERLKELLKSLVGLSPAQKHDRIKAAIEEWQGKNEQTDDILVIGLHA
ncbi:MAG: SpoIIE family protein phosphatase [Bacteroidia bacterium]|nr:SpoIIE family protein phosphatase [Bacteroidia bacterium]MDW8333182.1 SpoIIE family protein phosphatase [Bacteroidia bacterium]